MSQGLILPINKCRLTASWKTGAYFTRFGFAHFGADMVATDKNAVVFASGNGEVVATGRDSVVGNVVVVQYNNAQNRVRDRSWDVIFRYCHFARIDVRKGQKVTKDTVLGLYGNTGMILMAPHLHLEADIDTKWPLHSPTIRSGSFIKGTSAGATDKTMFNPLEFLHCKSSPPDNQTYVTANDAFIRNEDKVIAIVQ